MPISSLGSRKVGHLFPSLIGTGFASRRDVPIESRSGDPQLLTQSTDVSLRLAHSGHGEP